MKTALDSSSNTLLKTYSKNAMTEYDFSQEELVRCLRRPNAELSSLSISKVKYDDDALHLSRMIWPYTVLVYLHAELLFSLRSAASGTPSDVVESEEVVVATYSLSVSVSVSLPISNFFLSPAEHQNSKTRGSSVRVHSGCRFN
jgi:hypothetical protein